MIRYLFLALLLACTPACAVSIWNSTPVDPVLETYRIPVDVSSSGSPSHITPLTLKAYLESGNMTFSGDLTAANVYVGPNGAGTAFLWDEDAGELSVYTQTNAASVEYKFFNTNGKDTSYILYGNTYGTFDASRLVITPSAASNRMDIEAETFGTSDDDQTIRISPAGAGVLESTAPVKLASYTMSALPSASISGAGAIIFISDESGGSVLAFSDGTNWRRVTDRAIVS